MEGVRAEGWQWMGPVWAGALVVRAWAGLVWVGWVGSSESRAETGTGTDQGGPAPHPALTCTQRHSKDTALGEPLDQGRPLPTPLTSHQATGQCPFEGSEKQRVSRDKVGAGSRGDGVQMERMGRMFRIFFSCPRTNWLSPLTIGVFVSLKDVRCEAMRFDHRRLEK